MQQTGMVKHCSLPAQMVTAKMSFTCKRHNYVLMPFMHIDLR